jgi:hypothetical protein
MDLMITAITSVRELLLCAPNTDDFKGLDAWWQFERSNLWTQGTSPRQL